MGVDGEGHGLADRRQAGQRACADRHLVSYAADIENDCVERDRVEPAGELANHGVALAPCATDAASLVHVREWAWVMAMARASAASALAGAARGRRHFTMARICTLSPCPAPITVFFTAFGAYSAITSPDKAGTSSAIPRAWPSLSVADASRLTKVCSTAASLGARRPSTSDSPSKIWRSRKPKLSASSETTEPHATKAS